ncbi:amidohydrolase family protein [Schaalia sp. ZJ405]|uniref:amidohydrolase family protein n=1 Tax=Schaalia sp. ZJ405 TaxID=2709403 RepID=UPI0013EDF9E1|nr:amidohydrolase family protein [Schaalia sp. ZJ405]
MKFDGWMLWADSPDSDATWTRGTWLIENGRIVADAGGLAPTFRGYAVPGLIDIHCHIGIGAKGPIDRADQLRQVRQTVNSGVLAIRDCGTPRDNSWIQDEPLAPILIRCGQHLARPKRYIRGLPVDVDDPKDLPSHVAAQASRSDGWVKIVGDWIDRSQGADADLAPLWPRSVLVDAVQAAHDAGARVAVHAFSHVVIDDLLEAGVDDIEHGTGLDADQAQEVAARGILVTPTLRQVELFNDFAAQAGEKYPRYGQTMNAMYRNRREHFAMLADSGVTLTMGTDSGGYQDHGTIAKELELWVEYGASPSSVIDAATWRTRARMYLPSLFDGACADLVVYDEDPRSDIRRMRRPGVVVRNGVIVAENTPSC